MQRILIVEDDLDIQELLKNFLQEVGYAVTLASDGIEAISLFASTHFDLILLDIMLPKIDGFTVCELIRKQSRVPIIMLTALNGEEEQIRGLDLQVDDYITKPFSMPILVRKIGAVLRRSSMIPEQEHQTITYKNLVLDMDSYTAVVDGVSFDLTQREFEVLRELLLNQGRVLTRQNLLDKLWKYDFYGDERVVDTHIKNLRKKLGIDFIQTIRGVGYKIDKEIKGSLFAKIFAITFLLTSICCVLTYTVISWLVPKTYSTTLDASLENTVSSFIAELQTMSPLESGTLFDEFLLNNNGVLLQLSDDDGNAIELPSQGAKEFPRFLDGGIATENTDPAAYRATHSYLFSFAGSDTVYTLTVAGSAHEVDLLRNTLANVFIILFFVILIIATLASMIYSRYVTRPVLRLSAVSKNMSELNFNWKCEEDRTDELGVLAHSLNEMSKKLSAALENLQAANIKLQADIEHEKELEQAQLDFFSAVSHELKTPITIIKGQTEGMILNVGDYQDRNKYLSRSLEIINTMESMVQEILTVSRMKSSKVGLRKEKMDFSALLKREYALFEDLIVQKEIDWNENISPALQIVADKMLIQKAINNIVSNAILYSPRGSSIYMDAFSKNGSVVFQIENTGVHIPEAEIPKLFDAFYRMEQSRNRKTGGSGLGLYIVKTILEQHNIIYSLKNTDRGVLFSIRF